MTPDDIAQLKAQVARQQLQIEELTRRLDQFLTTAEGRQGRPLVASTTPTLPRLPEREQDRPPDESSPLQMKIGDAYLTPFGFMDFTGVFRSHAAGGGLGTNFGSIPYGNNVFQNHLSEFPISMQNSRVGFRIDAIVKRAHVIAYMESDFLGNNSSNVAVSSNSNTMRSRLYWVDARRKHWEVLGGQTWSLLTPGRSGISPLPSNVLFPLSTDVNYMPGLVWARIPELRFVYYPTEKIAVAVAFDNQEQYVGGSAGGGVATFPSNLAGVYAGGELNNQDTGLNAPQVFPDTIVKLALDPSPRFHLETGGVLRQFRVWNPNNRNHYTTPGGGGFMNLNFDLFPGFRVLTNNYWSDGGGRYIFGQAPDLVARADGSLSLIHSGSTMSGTEYTRAKTIFYGYYSGIYIGRNVTIDTTAAKPALVGYGYTGAPSGQNRSIQEITFGFTHTFWKDPRFGSLALMNQYSHLLRNPWFIAPGQPKDAHLNMIFLNLRYTLPGSAPAMK